MNLRRLAGVTAIAVALGTASACSSTPPDMNKYPATIVGKQIRRGDGTPAAITDVYIITVHHCQMDGHKPCDTTKVFVSKTIYNQFVMGGRALYQNGNVLKP